MWFLALGVVLSLGETGAGPFIQSRVIGGWECKRHSQPWQVAVSHHGLPTCGGVLLHPQWVLTAAHCIKDTSQVWLGRHNLFEDEDSAQYLTVRHRFPHPLYDLTLLEDENQGLDSDQSHDLMLLHLSEPANLTDTVQVLGLPTEEPTLGSTCFTSGWGRIHSQQSLFPRALQCVDLSLMSNRMCEGIYSGKVTKFMLCAGRLKGGKDTCVGDSGGPLICDGMLQGITSWGGNPCALPKQPALYTKLMYYRKWIKEVMMANP
ncbi:kallikrein-2-like [Perognathus longimembris pacificus]|uniref:kallikrein-2-like n=1 Tax=Perognathus longimembris pacificus TaxID=214514 RepID=UPI0020190AD2|nr:kallikrein-2-like [Perognathus longimembris pacificus]